MAAVKIDVNDIPEYYSLPPETTSLGKKPEKELRKVKHDELLEFLERHNVIAVMSECIQELYFQFYAVRPVPNTLEFFLEALAAFVPVNEKKSKLMAEIAGNIAYLRKLRQDCREMQGKLRAENKSEAAGIYQSYSESEAEMSESETENSPRRRRLNRKEWLQSQELELVTTTGTTYQLSSATPTTYFTGNRSIKKHLPNTPKA